jgi:hypothetical protein
VREWAAVVAVGGGRGHDKKTKMICQSEERSAVEAEVNGRLLGRCVLAVCQVAGSYVMKWTVDKKEGRSH